MGGEKEIVFQILENTTIKTDYGQKVDFAELKNGMSVTVAYMREGDDNRPLSIRSALCQRVFGKNKKKNNKGNNKEEKSNYILKRRR